jgi:hypothetical protein
VKRNNFIHKPEREGYFENLVIDGRITPKSRKEEIA